MLEWPEVPKCCRQNIHHHTRVTTQFSPTSLHVGIPVHNSVELSPPAYIPMAATNRKSWADASVIYKVFSKFAPYMPVSLSVLGQGPWFSNFQLEQFLSCTSVYTISTVQCLQFSYIILPRFSFDSRIALLKVHTKFHSIVMVALLMYIQLQPSCT